MSQNTQENTCARVSFLIKLQAYTFFTEHVGPMLLKSIISISADSKLVINHLLVPLQSNFIEIALRHGCSDVNLLHFFRTPFLKNTSGWLLLSFLWFNKWNKKSKPKLAKESIMRIILDSQFSPGNIIFIRLASTQNLAQLNQPFSPRYVNFFSLSFSVCHQASALAINLTVHDYFITFQTSNIIFWWYFHCDKKQV